MRQDSTKANPNRSPLNAACWQGKENIIRRLLKAGANPNYINGLGLSSACYLFLSPEIPRTEVLPLLELLVTYGFDLWNSQDKLGWTLLHKAAVHGEYVHVKTLVECYGASLDVLVEEWKWRAIHCSAKSGNESTFKYFWEVESPAQRSYFSEGRGWNLLHLAARGGSRQILFTILYSSLIMGDFARLQERKTDICYDKDIHDLLKGKEALAIDIAIAYGHRDAYEGALQDANQLFSTL